MKKSKMTMRVMCAILTLLLVVGMVPAQVNAVSNEYKEYRFGDVTGDGKVTIQDATQIQKYVAKKVSFNANQIKAADVNFDGKVNIKDITNIQKYCAANTASFSSDYTKDTDYAWTSIDAASYKNFPIRVPKGDTITVWYIDGNGWIDIKRDSKTNAIKVSTFANTTEKTRDAIVEIKSGNEPWTIYVRQLPKYTGIQDAQENFNCYSYALRLSSDPRLQGGSKITGPRIDPGKLSNSSWDYSAYNVINYRNNREAMFEDAEEYIFSTVEDDLATMGWGIKRIEEEDPANVKVAAGNWVIALALNPTECYMGKTRTARISGRSAEAEYEAIGEHDYHWYRRVDSANGTPLRWEHKMGDSDSETISFPFPKNPNDIPRGMIEANGHKLCTVDYYWDCFGGYADAFGIDGSSAFSYYSYCGSTRKTSKSERAGEFLNAEKMCNAYVLIGYYVVGPNVG